MRTSAGTESIRNMFINKIDFEKDSHDIAVIRHLFRSFIEEAEPVLYEVYTDRIQKAVRGCQEIDCLWRNSL